MKRWSLIASALTLGMAMALCSLAPLTAHGQLPGQTMSADNEVTPATYNDTGSRKRIYLFSTQFPPDVMTQYPLPPAKETLFWQLLDREMGATPDLMLTEDPTQADYRVELRCGGIRKCSKLIVNLKSPSRDVLVTYPIKNISSKKGFGGPKLEEVAQLLAQTLEERLKQLPQGGYGTYDQGPSAQ